MELPITSPLEGAPRLGTSGLGVDRDGGERSHRGVDIDATVGEPVRAVADGVVQFAGVDMTGDHPALGLLPRQLKRWRRPDAARWVRAASSCASCTRTAFAAATST